MIFLFAGKLYPGAADIKLTVDWFGIAACRRFRIESHRVAARHFIGSSFATCAESIGASL